MTPTVKYFIKQILIKYKIIKMAASEVEFQKLSLESIIGFGGTFHHVEHSRVILFARLSSIQYQFIAYTRGLNTLLITSH